MVDYRADHPPGPSGQPDPFTDTSHAVPLTPAAPRPPFAQYQSHSSSPLPAAYLQPPPPHHPYPSSPRSSQATTSSPSSPSRDGLNEYIGLPTRLLLTSFSPALLPIILTIVHLSTNRRSTADMADSLRSSMYAACTGLAKGAGTLQTIPRYMAMQTNEQMIRVTQGMIKATGMGLIHMVTIIETVVIFVINTYRSLLVCTIELAVRGTLELMIGAVRGITQAVTASLDEIRSAIQSSVSGANNVIQEAVSRLSRATSLIGIDMSIPQFTIPELSRLSNVTIPNDFEQSLVRLNSTIPSLDELRSKLDSIISQPFSLLKSEMNSTRLELASSFNSSLLPTPPMSALSTESARQMEDQLCGNLDTSLVDNTAQALGKLSSIAIGLMCLMLFICWALLVGWEWYRWRCLKDSVETVQSEWKEEGRADAWRAVAVIENPMLEKYGSPALRRLARKERTRRNARWYLSYLGHPTTLTLLLISLLCLLALQLQLVALNALKAHAQSNADAAVNASTASMTSKLNDMAFQQSRQYAADYNEVVRRYQSQMDERLIGHWVNTTGVALNSTLNEFYDDVENILDKVFGNTVLSGPMNTFLYCILGSKIDSLSRALTWLHDNARIDLPLLPDNVLVLSPEAMNEMTGPITAAAIGSSSNQGQGEADDGIVNKLIGHWEKATRAEMFVYSILIGVWAVLALVGLIVMLWNSGPGDRFRAKKTAQGHGAGAQDGYGHAYAEGEKRGWQYAHGGSDEKAPIHQQYATRAQPDDARPSPNRSSTGFSRLASLVGPADRFLKFGRQTPAPGNASELPQRDNSNVAGKGAERYNDKERLVLDGDTSEHYNSSPSQVANVPVSRHDSSYPYYNYNHHTINANSTLHAGNHNGNGNRAVRDSQLESPPAFWIKRAADAAMSPIKSFFPSGSNGNGQGEGFGSRAEKHGRAIHLRGPEGGNVGAYERMRDSQDGRYDDAQIGLALGGLEYRESMDDYPLHASPSRIDPHTSAKPFLAAASDSAKTLSDAPSSYGKSNGKSLKAKAKELAFPRPMSRASTHYDGHSLQPWQMKLGNGSEQSLQPTPTPPMPVPKDQGGIQGKLDSIDMLDGQHADERVAGWLRSGARHVDPFADEEIEPERERSVGVNGKSREKKRNPFTDMGRI